VAQIPVEGPVETRATISVEAKQPPQLDPAMAELMRAASPVNFVRPGLPPFLLVHGTGDRIVNYQQSVRFQAKLRADGVPCDLITIPGGLHGNH